MQMAWKADLRLNRENKWGPYIQINEFFGQAFRKETRVFWENVAGSLHAACKLERFYKNTNLVMLSDAFKNAGLSCFLFFGLLLS